MNWGRRRQERKLTLSGLALGVEDLILGLALLEVLGLGSLGLVALSGERVLVGIGNS